MELKCGARMEKVPAFVDVSSGLAYRERQTFATRPSNEAVYALDPNGRESIAEERWLQNVRILFVRQRASLENLAKT